MSLWQTSLHPRTRTLAQTKWGRLRLRCKGKERQEAAQRYSITGVPAVIILKSDTGTILNIDARGQILSDPEGVKFPWLAPPTKLHPTESQVLTLACETVGLAAVKESHSGRMPAQSLMGAADMCSQIRAMAQRLGDGNESNGTRPERLQRPASGAPSDKCRDLISHWSVSRV